MVDCVIKNWDGADQGTATLDLRVAREASASHIVHRALVRQLANARQGTVCTKTRAEVRGGGAQTLAAERNGPGPGRF
jgi:large subunit ribosomal protein L4